MKIENKEMLLYSMNTAYEELKCAMIEYNMNEKEVYFRLGSCLHWIVCSCRCGSAHTYDVNGHRADDAAVGIGSGLFCFGDILSTGRRLIY